MSAYLNSALRRPHWVGYLGWSLWGVSDEDEGAGCTPTPSTLEVEEDRGVAPKFAIGVDLPCLPLTSEQKIKMV